MVSGTSGAAIDGVIGDDGGKAVAAAVASERRFKVSDKVAPSLFVD